MTCNIIIIHDKNKKGNWIDVKGFIISDIANEYTLIVDENHTIRDIHNTYYTYTHDKELKL